MWPEQPCKGLNSHGDLSVQLLNVWLENWRSLLIERWKILKNLTQVQLPTAQHSQSIEKLEVWAGKSVQLLVQALVISCLDCNSLLVGPPAFATKPLQKRTQNAAARLAFNLPKFSHVTSAGFLLQPHPILDDGAGLQGRRRNCTHLPPNTGQTTGDSTSTSLFPAGRLVPPSLGANKGHSA